LTSFVTTCDQHLGKLRESIYSNDRTFGTAGEGKWAPGMFNNLETKRWAKYERLRDASQRAADAKAEREETLRRKVEERRARSPIRLTREEMLLVDQKYKKKRRNLLSDARRIGSAVLR
jgi:ribosomal protein S2